MDHVFYFPDVFFPFFIIPFVIYMFGRKLKKDEMTWTS